MKTRDEYEDEFLCSPHCTKRCEGVYECMAFGPKDESDIIEFELARLEQQLDDMICGCGQ